MRGNVLVLVQLADVALIQQETSPLPPALARKYCRLFTHAQHNFNLEFHMYFSQMFLIYGSNLQ
jgi:hypothetical protein